MKYQAVSTKGKSAHERFRVAGSGSRLEIVIPEKDIRRRVRELGKQINRDYAGKTVHVVAILENGFVFMADLVRALTVPVVCSFVRSLMRDSDSSQVPVREIMYLPPIDATAKDLLLVVGVLQSGVTLDHLYRTLLAQEPASLRTAALIDKTKDRKVDIAVDYSGFQLSGRFFVGYGLAYQEHYRNLPFLAGVV
jgi:hypoxanthine phosphoribosyltransferase